MRRQQGFTLLELLVVMVLMAILSAAALGTLNFSFGDSDIETEARRIGALVSLASEEALLTGREIGLELDNRQLRFWYYEDLEQRWLPLSENDGPFRDRELSEAIETDLLLEGRPVTLATGSKDDEVDSKEPGSGGDRGTEARPQPQILMFSSGQMTPFTLLLEDRELDAEWRIEADLLGRVKVEAVE